MLFDTDKRISQRQFAAIIGASREAVSQYVKAGVLQPGGTLGEWLAALYLDQRETAAGRRGDGPLDLCQQRARQSKSIADRNEFELRKSRGEYAPKELLCQVLSMSASTVRTHLLSLPSRIKSRVPETPIKTFVAMEEEVHITLTNLATHRLPPELAQAFAEWELEGKEPEREPQKNDQGKRSRRSAPPKSRTEKARSKNQKVEKKARKDTRPRRSSEFNVSSVQAAAPAIQEKGARPEVSE